MTEIKAWAKHKDLENELPVLELDLKWGKVKCEGKVKAGLCIQCPVTEECEMPIFNLQDVTLRFEGLE